MNILHINYLLIIPDDIRLYIIENTNIKCHTCYKKYNLSFYKKQANFYYCSELCYNCI